MLVKTEQNAFFKVFSFFFFKDFFFKNESYIKKPQSAVLLYEVFYTNIKW